jgi:glycosyltransferase involved in cell wall biosynthesis
MSAETVNPSAERPPPAPVLRVAVVASSLRLGGAEKQTAYLTRALAEAGTEVRFFHLGEGGHYEGVLRQLEIPVLEIYRPNRPLWMLARLSKTLRGFRPHVVFAPQFGDLHLVGIAGRLCKALTLGGLRSDGFYELDGNGWRSRWMLRLAHGLISNSHRARRNLASRGVNTAKIKILPNVLDLRDFDARSQAVPPVSAPPDRVIAAAVGSLQPCKRFDRFLTALALARRRAPSLLGVLAGSDAGVGQDLAMQAAELGLAPNHVIFLGECHSVPALLANAGFLVLCSDYEGFPNVILEAMAARLPVITTPVGDAEQIVLQDQTGFIVSGEDVEVLADRMVRLALDPATRTRLGDKGRTQVAREYGYDSLPLRLLSLFQELAALNKRPKLVEPEAAAGVAAPLLGKVSDVCQSQ